MIAVLIKAKSYPRVHFLNHHIMVYAEHFTGTLFLLLLGPSRIYAITVCTIVQVKPCKKRLKICLRLLMMNIMMNTPAPVQKWNFVEDTKIIATVCINTQLHGQQ